MALSRAEGIFLLAVVLVGAAIGSYSGEHNTAYVDEYTYARLGYSLSQGHLASDSSFLPIYTQYGLVRNDIVTPYGHVNSVEPWLDHPPLVGFLLVPFSLAGVNPRFLIVALDLGIVVLLYAFVRDKSRLAAALTCCSFLLFMALYPILTMLFLDSAVSFFLVLTLGLLGRFTKVPSRRMLYLAGVVAGLAALSKVPGVSAILFLALFLFYMAATRKMLVRGAIVPILIAAGVALVWPVYAVGVEPGLFWQLTSENISRSALSNVSLVQVITSLESSATFTKQSYALVVDPLLQVSWVATLGIVAMKKYRMAALAFGTYLGVLLLLRYAPPYMAVPLFPFFALSVGVAAAELVRLVASKWTAPQ